MNLTNNCKKCNEYFGFAYDKANKTCNCPKDYYMNNNLCHTITGCIGPIINKNTTVCTICDQQINF